MSDTPSPFHKTAVSSVLFKGRKDWYFCYLKAERIAHVFSVLAQRVHDAAADDVRELALSSAGIPRAVAYFAAGNIDAAEVLADLFALLSAIRLAGTNCSISKENTSLLVHECEALAEKFSSSVHISPFVTTEDFSVAEVATRTEPQPLLSSHFHGLGLVTDPNWQVRDSKGQGQRQLKTDKKTASSSGRSDDEYTDRAMKILECVKKSNGLSIKDISAVVHECGEKTIQRELAVLLQKGLIKKTGERRWSIYLPA